MGFHQGQVRRTAIAEPEILRRDLYAISVHQGSGLAGEGQGGPGSGQRLESLQVLTVGAGAAEVIAGFFPEYRLHRGAPAGGNGHRYRQVQNPGLDQYIPKEVVQPPVRVVQQQAGVLL